MVILKLFLDGDHVWTHMNIRLAHVLVGDSVSQVIDMEMSNCDTRSNLDVAQ
jgi:hypothetical protein